MSDVLKEKSGCLDPCGDSAQLKRSHMYFYQAQPQHLVCERQCCDFVLWTPSDILIERISIDVSFCKELKQKSKAFFEQVLLPQLLLEHWTSLPVQETAPTHDEGSADSECYFYCGSAEYGEMVECRWPTMPR